MRATEAALADAGLLTTEGRFAGECDTTAVVVSTHLGTLDMAASFTDTIARQTVTGLSPLGLPQTSSNVCAGYVAIRYGLRGPSLTVCNGSSGGLDALYWARVLLAAGRARAAVVVGVEPAGPAVTRLLGRETTDAAAAVVLEAASGAAARHRRAPCSPGSAGRPRRRRRWPRSTPVRGSAPVRPRRPVTGWACGSGTRRRRTRTRSPRGAPPGPGTRTRPAGRALGVLQCAAAVAYLDGAGTGPVLATAGGGAEPGSALLLAAAHR
ncbi:beta-ketoacyl synthase N-terminal-like domain-containing protein [Streptomyces sp. M19]